MNTTTATASGAILKNLNRLIPDLEALHSPQFAPVLHPTLETGVEALVVAALAWLASEGVPSR